MATHDQRFSAVCRPKISPQMPESDDRPSEQVSSAAPSAGTPF